MHDILTFGSATKDIFVKTKQCKTIKNRAFLTGKGLCLDSGSKVDVEEMAFFSGGGGTNSAATFHNQGFNVAYCGAVGNDLAGREIIEELKTLGISTQFIVSNNSKTNHSIVFEGVGGERTILVYRGASETLTTEQIPFEILGAKWFYIAPLSGELCSVFDSVVDFAKKNNIKVALNPGSTQLSLAKKDLERNISKSDILILNQEEASLLTKIPFSKEKEIFKAIDKMGPGIVIMTNGAKGVLVSDGEYIYKAVPTKANVVDKTGAGDAFASGFVSSLMNSSDIESAIQLGMANAGACLQTMGAKPGLLKKGQDFNKVQVIKTKI